MKKLFKIGLLSIAFVAASLVSCEKSDSDLNSHSGDADLIAAIEKSSELFEIDVVPTAVDQVLKTEYYESYTERAFEAQNLGYKVMLRVKQGSMAGEQNCVYFDTNGKELDPELAGSKAQIQSRIRERQRQREIMRDCFTFDFPVSYIMADDTEIVIEDDDSWYLIKEWHQANPDIKERGSLVYPGTVIFDDGTELIVYTEDEMQELREECKEAAERIRERRSNNS